MTTGDSIGWLAAALTLLTFSMRSMVALRIAALSANVCFMTYGALSELYPVIALHALLFPCNLVRLCQLRPPGHMFQPHPAERRLQGAMENSAPPAVEATDAQRSVDMRLRERDHVLSASGRSGVRTSARDWLDVADRRRPVHEVSSGQSAMAGQQTRSAPVCS